MKFQGNFVALLPLQKEHVESLLAAANEGRSTYHLTWVPETIEGMKGYVESALQDQELRRAIPFVIVDIKNDKIVGSTRFGNLEYWKWPENIQRKNTGDPAINPPKSGTDRDSDTVPGAAPDAAEIGWTWLSEPSQRTPINTEMKLLMLKHAFEVWQIHRMTFKTDARNERSRKAIERIGGHFDGILRSHMPAYDGAIRDSAFYSILKSEWDSVRLRLQAKLGKNLN